MILAGVRVRLHIGDGIAPVRVAASGDVDHRLPVPLRFVEEESVLPDFPVEGDEAFVVQAQTLGHIIAFLAPQVREVEHVPDPGAEDPILVSDASVELLVAIARILLRHEIRVGVAAYRYEIGWLNGAWLIRVLRDLGAKAVFAQADRLLWALSAVRGEVRKNLFVVQIRIVPAVVAV